MPKLNKEEIYKLVNFIQDGFLTQDVYFLDTYLTFRSLTKIDRGIIHGKFKYLDKKYNFNLIIDVLAKVIYKIGGIEISRELVRKRLSDISSNVVSKLYDSYSSIEEKEFNILLGKIDKFSNCIESRNLWNIYKEKLDVGELNEYQYYWVLLNVNKDKVEQYKFEWSKIEYMTNTICAFINPKEYKRLKHQMEITKQFEEDEESDEFEPVETKDKRGVVDWTTKVMNDMVRREGEGKQEYFDRVSSTLVDINKGKIVDEHDRIVREYDLNLIRNLLLDRRTRTEVFTVLRKRSEFVKSEDLNTAMSKDGIYHEGAAYVGAEDIDDKLSKEIQKEGYFFNGNSYADIVNDKFFSSVPKDEKIKVFEEVMNKKIDLNAEVTKYLNKNATEEQKQQFEQAKAEKPIDTIAKETKVAASVPVVSSADTKEVFKDEIVFDETEEEFIKKERAAFKAANMNIDLNSKTKIVKNTPKKMNKEIIEKSRKLNTDDDIDQIIIK